MTLDRRPIPDLARIERYRSERLLQLHQRRTPREATRSTLVGPSRSTGEVVFNLSGPISVSSSDRWPTPAAVTVTRARATLRTAGSSTTTALVKVGSTTVATITLASTETAATVAVGADAAAGALVWIDATAAGTGAVGLVVAVEYL